jgi:AcrR family transcriptional regulator
LASLLRVRNRAGIETQERILAATKRLLAERGLDGVTIKGICDAAEVHAGSFYNLFESKEQVVLTAVREAIKAVDPHPAGTGEDHLDELVDAYIRFVMDDQDLARVYLTVAVSGGLTDPAIRARVLSHHEDRHARFVAAHHRDRPHIEAEQAAELIDALVAALNGYAFQWLLDPSFDFENHARRLLSYA